MSWPPSPGTRVVVTHSSDFTLLPPIGTLGVVDSVTVNQINHHPDPPRVVLARSALVTFTDGHHHNVAWECLAEMPDGEP